MSSLDQYNRQPPEHDQQLSLSHQTRQPSTSDVSLTIASSPSDGQNSTSGTEFHIPDTLSECGDLIIKQQKEIMKQKTLLVEKNTRLIRWSTTWPQRLEHEKKTAKSAKDQCVLEVAAQKQKTRELELENTTLTRAKANAEAMFKLEHEKVYALRLEYDHLQKDLHRHRVLADQSDSILRAKRDNLNDLVQSFGARIDRNITDFLEEAFHQIENDDDSVVRNNNHLPQQDLELRNELKRTSHEQIRGSQAARSNNFHEHLGDSQAAREEGSQKQLQAAQAAANPGLAGSYHIYSTARTSPRRHSSFSPNARKRSAEDTDGPHWKRVKTEAGHGGILPHQVYDQTKRVEKLENQLGIRLLDQSKGDTLDPRAQAIARRQVTKTTIPKTTSQSI